MCIHMHFTCITCVVCITSTGKIIIILKCILISGAHDKSISSMYYKNTISNT